jgi:hypothetical protein
MFTNQNAFKNFLIDVKNAFDNIIIIINNNIMNKNIFLIKKKLFKSSFIRGIRKKRINIV